MTLSICDMKMSQMRLLYNTVNLRCRLISFLQNAAFDHNLSFNSQD